MGRLAGLACPGAGRGPGLHSAARGFLAERILPASRKFPKSPENFTPGATVEPVAHCKCPSTV